MCGRFQLPADPAEVAEAFDLDEVPDLAPRWNVAPGQDVAIVRAPSPGSARILQSARWGFVPHFATDPGAGPRPINARAEGIAVKPTFRDALQRRRCLVPATGFYEWGKGAGRRRQPWLFTSTRGRLFAFAGLWDRWRGGDGATLDSCLIVTTRPTPAVATVHDRMPVMLLDRQSQACWLDPAVADPSALLRLLQPPSDADVVGRRVSFFVSDAAHEGPECEGPPLPPRQGSLFD